MFRGIRFHKWTCFYLVCVPAVFVYLRWRFRFWGRVYVSPPFRDEPHHRCEISVDHWVRNGLSQGALIHRTYKGWRMTWNQEVYSSLWAALDAWVVQVRKQIPPRRLCDLSPEERVTVLARANGMRLGDKKRRKRRHRHR